MAMSVSPSAEASVDVTSDCDDLTTLSVKGESAHGGWRFGHRDGARGPIRYGFCLRPLDSAGERVLFSCYAAIANNVRIAEKQNFKAIFYRDFRELETHS
jgi:hypothetical protein